jgi:acyl-coenzyme A synthetase/AMP-(fatty) acid ligase
MTKKQRTRNLGALFEAYAGSPTPIWHLDRPFDIAPEAGRRYDATDLAHLVADMSGRLYAAGLRRGDRLGIIKDNHLDVILLAAAAGRIGALPAMITSTFSPEILAKMMERLEPKVIAATESVLAAAAAKGIRLAGPGTALVAISGAEHAPESVPLADLAGSDIPAADLRPDDEPFLCTHTSGTTGVPKFVVHSPNTLIGVLSKLETMRIPFLSTRPDDTIASCIAFCHSRAVTWTFAQFALPPAKVVVLGGSDPATAAATLAEHPPTTLEACPNIFQRWEPLTDSHPHLFHNVRAYLSTFDAIHPRTISRFMAVTKRRMPVWGQSWGQSEVGPATLAVYSHRKVRRTMGADTPFTNNVGRPIPFVTRIRVVDPATRKKLPRGKQGLVLIRTKGRCLTYLGEPERHAEKTWGAWWNTGDIGLHTRTGNLHILDREVDMIPGASGIELESILLERLPGASEVIVLGSPGRLPLPVVGWEDGELPAELWQRAAQGLPAMDAPRTVRWEDFPRTGTWKVRRHELRQRMFETQDTYGTGRWT